MATLDLDKPQVSMQLDESRDSVVELSGDHGAGLLRLLPALICGGERAAPCDVKGWLGGPRRLDDLALVAPVDGLERLYIAPQHGHAKLPVGAALVIQVDTEPIEQLVQL